MGCCSSSPEASTPSPGNALAKQGIKILRQIGEGNFSKVHICEKDGEKFACKVCDPATDDRELYMEALMDEIEVLKHVKGHPNIVRLHLVEQIAGVYYLVMQYMNGGDLCDYVMRKQSLTEYEASRIILQVARALNHCHKNGVVHRDLKPENLLIHTQSGDMQVVLCDFGFAKKLGKTPRGTYEPQTIFRGTPGYVPPEMMMNKEYLFEVDMWSFGIVIYVLLCGYLPYNINNRETLPANTNLAALFHVHFSEKSWKTISAAAKNLIKALLEPNQKLRLSADRLLQHPWVKNDALKTPQMVLDSPQVLRRTLGKPQVSPRVISARLADRVREQERKDVVDHSQIALALQLPHERRV